MKVITVIVFMFAAASCGGGEPEYSTFDYDTAMTAFNVQENPDEVCDILWMYDKDEVKEMLQDAYDAGKPDGDIWVNANIEPTKAQVMAMVDIQFEHCANQ